MRKLALLGIVALGIGSLMGQNAPSKDVIVTKTGQEMQGTVQQRSDAGVSLRSESSTGAIVTQLVPADNIERIDFADTEKLREEIAKTTKRDAGRMLLEWRKDSPYIDIPNSPAGEVGVRTAQLLLETGGEDNAKAAAEILATIQERAWNSVDKDRATALTIDTLRLTGKKEEAKEAAQNFLSGDASAESKAEVSYYLALVLADEYKDFLADNPRWDFDPYMRPVRQRLYNQVLDSFIAPYLQYGAPPAITPKCLLSTVEFLDQYGEHQEAVAFAQDLTTIFSDSPEAAEAKKYLENN